MKKIPGLDSYFGGKASSGTYQKIINHIQPHDTLIIPFLGHCAITRSIKRARLVLVNDRDEEVAEKWRAAGLANVEVYNLNALDFLQSALKRADLGRAVIYLDPPYPLGSRKSARAVYKHEMSDKDHWQLLQAIKLLRVDCLISTYPNDLYRQELAAWNVTEFQNSTRSGTATEWLFYNYPTPKLLHDTQFAGENYREREYYKRKASRWVERYKSLEPHAQQYILQELLQGVPRELLYLVAPPETTVYPEDGTKGGGPTPPEVTVCSGSVDHRQKRR